MAPLRVGILGAARIAPAAIVRPARAVDDVEVAAVAARDREKAHKFATKHDIPRVVATYDELVDDPDIDVIYNPLPNGLHGKWTVRAIEAGKHVLCEKPFTANADEAVAVAAVAAASDRVVMEAFHYRYHPLTMRAVEIMRSGELGPIRHVESALCAPLIKKDDIRWQLDLAGGSLMDMGCYPIHMVRSVVGREPEVTKASARERSAGVDRWIQADLQFGDGCTGRITAAMLSGRLLGLSTKVVCERGELKIFNPQAPQLLHRFTVRSATGRRHERFPRVPTYTYQLRAFVDAVVNGAPVLTNTDDAIANMRVIDAVYGAAGLPLRQPST